MPAALVGGSHASIGKCIDGDLTRDKVDENSGLNGMQQVLPGAITCSAPLCCQSVIQTRVASGHVTRLRFYFFAFDGTLGRHARGPARILAMYFHIRPGAQYATLQRDRSRFWTGYFTYLTIFCRCVSVYKFGEMLPPFFMVGP
jgi:hypothetical protein